MAKNYGDVPCVKICGIIHVTTSGISCLCGKSYTYATHGRNGESAKNIIWRELEYVSCPKCKELSDSIN